MAVPDTAAPLVLPDGRTYDVLSGRVESSDSDKSVCRVVIEVQERGRQDYLCFCVQFSPRAFKKRLLSPDNGPALLLSARQKVWKYLFRNRQAVPRSRCERPVVMNYR